MWYSQTNRPFCCLITSWTPTRVISHVILLKSLFLKAHTVPLNQVQNVFRKATILHAPAWQLIEDDFCISICFELEGENPSFVNGPQETNGPRYTGVRGLTLLFWSCFANIPRWNDDMPTKNPRKHRFRLFVCPLFSFLARWVSWDLDSRRHLVVQSSLAGLPQMRFSE